MTITTRFKLGKGPAVRPYGLSDMAVYAKGKLPAPPTSFAVPNVGPWGMMDNDTYGCCTISAAGHSIMVWNAEVHEKDPVPDDNEIANQYFAITGGQDSGAVEADVLQLWHTQGLFSPANKIAGYAPVNPRDIEAVHQTVALFGAAYIGVALPYNAQDQFQNGEPWTVEPDDQIEGGHAVVIVGYDPHYLYAVTWGAVQKVTYPWFSRYCQETWCVLSQEFSEAGHDSLGIDLAALQADLKAI